MAIQVVKARKKYNVPYPAMYASEAENKDAKLFNCVQRGHQNSLELMPVFFMLMIVGGIKHPLVCSSLGTVYIFARLGYFIGYATGVPENRLTIGKYNLVMIFGLMICSLFSGVNILASS